MAMFEFHNAMASASCGCGFPSRRAISAALVCTAVASMMPRAASAASTDAEDERFMRVALEEARAADFPFGAVIVRDGQLIARGRNLGRTNADPTAHGEMTAIRACVATHGGAALNGSTIYTTGEPCAMCMGAILWSRMGRVVFAASLEQLATRIDQIMITGADLAGRAKFAPIAITGGILANEAMALFPKGR